MTRRYLKVLYDVTELTDDELAALTGEAVAQAERNKGDGFGSAGHRGVEVESYTFEDDEAE